FPWGSAQQCPAQFNPFYLFLGCALGYRQTLVLLNREHLLENLEGVAWVTHAGLSNLVVYGLVYGLPFGLNYPAKEHAHFPVVDSTYLVVGTPPPNRRK